MNSILVSIDGSAPATRALSLAIRLAGALGARLTIVHVQSEVPARQQLQGYLEHLLRLPESQRDQAEIDRIEEILAKAENDPGRWLLPEAEQTARLRGVGEVCCERFDGDPARLILRAARESQAEMIVVGRRGLGGFKAALLGSVSRQVTEAATCPVLTVP